MRLIQNKHTYKYTNKHTNKQTNKQATKSTKNTKQFIAGLNRENSIIVQQIATVLTRCKNLENYTETRN